MKILKILLLTTLITILSGCYLGYMEDNPVVQEVSFSNENKGYQFEVRFKRPNTGLILYTNQLYKVGDTIYTCPPRQVNELW